MNTTNYRTIICKSISLVLAFSFVLVSCHKDELVTETGTDTDDGNGPRVTSVEHIAASQMTVYNFIYPSTDPWGNPATLSGTITMSDQLTTTDSAEGIMLYNHFTIYRANQCPSNGNLTEQAMVVGSRLITISPDYYGFGSTEDKPQAYCISQANAKAAVDALIEGQKLLEKLGFKWKDNTFNVGYSQGGQTAMGVVRLITESHPEIHLTKTFAGGGSYDLATTYHRFVVIERSAMPSTVISVMLAYNHFKQLGIPRESMFIEPVLSHIDEWILSKRYTRTEIDNFVGNNDINSYITSTMMDTNSNYSHLMMDALESDNICKGWTPRSDEKIMLLHHTQDGAVPVQNTINMVNFLQQEGLSDIDVMIDDFGSVMGMPAHETGALTFISATKEWISQYLGITGW